MLWREPGGAVAAGGVKEKKAGIRVRRESLRGVQRPMEGNLMANKNIFIRKN